MDIPQATSIWKRPIPGRLFLRGFAVFVLAALLAYVYPFCSGVVHWSLHRHPSYWGATFTMPFRWVFDPEGTALTFRRTGPIATDLAIELSAKKNFTPPGGSKEEFFARMAAWEEELDRRIPWVPPSTHFILPAHSFGGQLRCNRRAMGRAGIFLQCTTEDLSWNFLYNGSPEYLHEVESIMTTLQPEANPKESKP